MTSTLGALIPDLLDSASLKQTQKREEIPKRSRKRKKFINSPIRIAQRDGVRRSCAANEDNLNCFLSPKTPYVRQYIPSRCETTQKFQLGQCMQTMCCHHAGALGEWMTSIDPSIADLLSGRGGFAGQEVGKVVGIIQQQNGVAVSSIGFLFLAMGLLTTSHSSRHRGYGCPHGGREPHRREEVGWRC